MSSIWRVLWSRNDFFLSHCRFLGSGWRKQLWKLQRNTSAFFAVKQLTDGDDGQTSAVPSLLLICSHIARQISMIKRFVLLTIQQMGWMLFVTLLLSLYLGQRRMRWNILFGYHQQCGAFDQLLGVWFLAGFFAVNSKGRLFKKRLERFLMGDCMTINCTTKKERKNKKLIAKGHF